MNIQKRNSIQIQGSGSTTMIFAHGFGCDQNMWRFMAPRFAGRYRVVTFDLVGSGGSDLYAYDASKYASLDGYADDCWKSLSMWPGAPSCSSVTS